jgi:hypothetical protein
MDGVGSLPTGRIWQVAHWRTYVAMKRLSRTLYLGIVQNTP